MSATIGIPSEDDPDGNRKKESEEFGEDHHLFTLNKPDSKAETKRAFNDVNKR